MLKIKIFVVLLLLLTSGGLFFGGLHYYKKCGQLEEELAAKEKQIAALQAGTQACLNREATALLDTLERENILKNMGSTLDNATEFKVIERINRPFH